MSASGQDDAAGGRGSWYHKPLGIVVLTLFVLGPLTLPLVWRSPALGREAKWIASALILVYSVFLVWETWVAVELVLGQLQI